MYCKYINLKLNVLSHLQLAGKGGALCLRGLEGALGGCELVRAPLVVSFPLYRQPLHAHLNDRVEGGDWVRGYVDRV